MRNKIIFDFEYVISRFTDYSIIATHRLHIEVTLCSVNSSLPLAILDR